MFAYTCTCFYFEINQYQCGQVRAGDQVKVGLMSSYVKTIVSQSFVEVMFIISFIGGTILLFYDFSIHAHGFIIHINLIAHYLNIFI